MIEILKATAAQWLLALATLLTAPPATSPAEPPGRLARNLATFFGAAPEAWRVRAIEAAALAYGVDAPTVAALCALESGVGLNPRGRVIWCGAMRASPERQPFAAARALRQWRDLCRNPLRALVAWRYGDGCRAPDPSRYAVRATRLAARFARP